MLKHAFEIFIVQHVQLGFFANCFRNSHASIFTLKVGVIENFCNRILRDVMVKHAISKVLATVINV